MRALMRSPRLKLNSTARLFSTSWTLSNDNDNADKRDLNSGNIVNKLWQVATKAKFTLKIRNRQDQKSIATGDKNKFGSSKRLSQS